MHAAANLAPTRAAHAGEPLTLEQLKAEVALFWVAGFETTAHTIGWACMLLATHPEVEARLAAELQAHGLLATPGNPTPRAAAWEDLGKLRYLSAVVNETTRMYPAAGSGTLRVRLAVAIEWQRQRMAAEGLRSVAGVEVGWRTCAAVPRWCMHGVGHWCWW
jgi:cytochrome P450